jgi:hypothetical protein
MSASKLAFVQALNALDYHGQHKLLRLGNPRSRDVFDYPIRLRSPYYQEAFTQLVKLLQSIGDIETQDVQNMIDSIESGSTPSCLMTHHKQWTEILEEVGTQAADPILLRNGDLNPAFHKFLKPLRYLLGYSTWARPDGTIDIFSETGQECFLKDLKMKYPEGLPYCEVRFKFFSNCTMDDE